ncbi:MAG: hypothetical protein H0V07_11245 [Propionibacteriales bacterium]|nr:hypothetical protein [Propionibacteriales bacterium]
MKETAHRFRLMTDDVSGIALWDAKATEELENQLPISGELRQRVKTWVNDYTETIGGVHRWWGAVELREHDRRGYQLSLDLQAALGPEYRIEYVFETSELRREIQQSKRPE